ncbi:MAG: hypothetical protein M1838_006189 [Thelocarpon superellum]|nr:MAG: hypothetical protein M1838_006189 [Thelocarpon superellum]
MVPVSVEMLDEMIRQFEMALSHVRAAIEVLRQLDGEKCREVSHLVAQTTEIFTTAVYEALPAGYSRLTPTQADVRAVAQGSMAPPRSLYLAPLVDLEQEDPSTTAAADKGKGKQPVSPAKSWANVAALAEGEKLTGEAWMQAVPQTSTGKGDAASTLTLSLTPTSTSSSNTNTNASTAIEKRAIQIERISAVQSKIEAAIATPHSVPSPILMPRARPEPRHTPSPESSTAMASSAMAPDASNVIWIFDLPNAVRHGDITKAIKEGPLMSIAFARDAKSTAAACCVVFQHVNQANVFLSAHRLRCSLNQWTFSRGETVRVGSKYGPGGDLELMAAPVSARRRLTIVRKGLFTEVNPQRLKADVDALAGPDNVELIHLFNSGNATIVLASVKCAIITKAGLDEKAAQKSDGLFGAVISFSKDPCEVELTFSTVYVPVVKPGKGGKGVW